MDNKIEQNKAQNDLHGQTAKISDLSSRNVSKFEFLTGKNVLSEKSATIKRFEYSPLGKELKAKIHIAKKQYQNLHNTYEFDEVIKKEKPTFKSYERSNLMYNSKFSVSEYYNIKFSLTSKYPTLLLFYSD